MKNITLLFILFSLVLPAKAVCMLDDSCALQENTINIENGLNRDNINEQKQSINFLPNQDNNFKQFSVPNVSSEYQSSNNIFQQTPAPKNCIFGVCLP